MGDNGFNTGHILIATLGGAAAGAAVALLLAPKSGRETRRQLNGYIEATKEKIAQVPAAIRTAGLAAQGKVSKVIAVAKP